MTDERKPIKHPGSGRKAGRLPTGKPRGRTKRPTSDSDEDLLNDREAAFIAHFLADPKRQPGKAAAAAGYSLKSAATTGSQLLTRPAIIAEIRRRTMPALRRLDITRDRVLQGLGELAFANVLDFIDVDVDGYVTVNMAKVDRVSAGAITELTTEARWEGKGDEKERVVTTKIKLADRHGPLKTLAQHLKLINSDEPTDVRTVRLIIEGAPDEVTTTYRNITPEKEAIEHGQEG